MRTQTPTTLYYQCLNERSIRGVVSFVPTEQHRAEAVIRAAWEACRGPFKITPIAASPPYPIL